MNISKEELELVGGKLDLENLDLKLTFIDIARTVDKCFNSEKPEDQYLTFFDYLKEINLKINDYKSKLK